MQDGFDKRVTILIAEDDDGHAELIEENLRDSGLKNAIIRFRDGREVLDFLFDEPSGDAPRRIRGSAYLLLLDIRMPNVSGVDVLRQLKQDPELKSMPVIMLTTTDDPREIQNCYALGCSCYVTKPIDYQKFSEMLIRLGLFLLVVQVPSIDV
jgi:CheY-like chemotaxis protein